MKFNQLPTSMTVMSSVDVIKTDTEVVWSLQSHLVWGLISHSCSPQPDINLRCEFPGSRQVNQGNVSVVATVQNCSRVFVNRQRNGRVGPEQLCVNSLLTGTMQWLKRTPQNSKLAPSGYESSSLPFGHHSASKSENQATWIQMRVNSRSETKKNRSRTSTTLIHHHIWAYQSSDSKRGRIVETCGKAKAPKSQTTEMSRLFVFVRLAFINYPTGCRDLAASKE